MGPPGGMMLTVRPVPDFVGFIRPGNPDIESSEWTPTPLWEELDEVSPDDATTELESSVNATTHPTVQLRDFEVTLTDPSGPPTGNETMVVRIRSWLDVVNGTANIRELRVQLKDTVTVRATGNFTLNVSGYQTHSFTLTQGEKDSISNYNDLRVNVRTRVSNDESLFPSSHGHVTWIEMEFS